MLGGNRRKVPARNKMLGWLSTAETTFTESTWNGKEFQPLRTNIRFYSARSNSQLTGLIYSHSVESFCSLKSLLVCMIKQFLLPLHHSATTFSLRKTNIIQRSKLTSHRNFNSSNRKTSDKIATRRIAVECSEGNWQILHFLNKENDICSVKRALSVLPREDRPAVGVTRR